jgi:hypothetical protein
VKAKHEHEVGRRIDDYLKKHGHKHYCGKCLGETVGWKPSAMIQLMKSFSGVAGYQHLEAKCDRCGNKRASTAYVGQMQPATAA